MFGALGPVDSWTPKLFGDIEMLFMQPKTPTKHSEIPSWINYFAGKKKKTTSDREMQLVFVIADVSFKNWI